MRWSRLLSVAVLTGLSACQILGAGADLPHEMPPNFFLGLQVREASQPPVDYSIEIQRSGTVKYQTTIRAPERRTFDGQLELGEAQMVRLYDAVQKSAFGSLASEYTAAEGASNRRENGQRVFYVVAGDADKRIDVSYAAVPQLDALHEAVLAEMPDYVLSGEGRPGTVLDRPDAFIADTRTKLFHHPDCDLVDKIPDEDREAFASEYEALNFGYNACPVCHPLDTRE